MNSVYLPHWGLLWVPLGIAFVGLISSLVYLGLVLMAASRYLRRSAIATVVVRDASGTQALPPVTILKPVHGMEAALERNLESFFLQDYPDFEIIFGAREPDDAGLAIARKLQERYPQVKSKIVLSGAPTWPNAKVFSQQKMLAEVGNSFIVMSDSDVHVDKDMLKNVIVPLLDEKVGLITCPYRGLPASGFGSTLEALGMSVEMTSGAMVADMLEGMRFALGPLTATRREVLEKIGGFPAVADYYSDDFELGHKVWAAGYSVIFSHYVVEHVLTPRSFWRTMADQLRWMKSTRYSRSAGHVGSGLTFAVPFGVLALACCAAVDRWELGLGLFLVAWLNRMLQSIVVGWGVTRDRPALYLSWLYPFRDLLGFFLWVASFTGGNFRWRGERYRFGKGGRITAADRPS